MADTADTADVAEQVRELAGLLAGGAVSVLQAVGEPRVLSLRAPGADWRWRVSPQPEVGRLLLAIVARLRPSGEERPVTVELRVDGSGGYEFRHTLGLDSVSPARLVLGPDYRYPNHPRPGMPRPATATPSDRPTDPAVLARVGGLVDRFVALYTAEHGEAPGFGAGYTEAEIAAAERSLGARLPEDLRALYRTVHDDLDCLGLIGYGLLPLEAVVEEYHLHGPGTSCRSDDLFDVEPVVFEARPPGTVRRVSRNDWWVGIATNCGGVGWCVDLDPGPRGTPGQVLAHGRDIAGVEYVHSSVTALLAQVVAELGSRGQDENPDPGALGLAARGSGDVFVHLPCTVSCEGSHRPLAAALADVGNLPAVQQIFLNDREHVDLADLASMPNLRDVSVNRAVSADLTLPHHLPVERLSVQADALGVAGLAGHPTLWHLTLAGTPAGTAPPVSAAPLATLPALAHLDLSAVEVTDLERLAGMAGLRVLVLNRGQWRHLHERRMVPAGLAAAQMSDDTALVDAVAWTTWLGRAPAAVQVLRRTR